MSVWHLGQLDCSAGQFNLGKILSSKMEKSEVKKRETEKEQKSQLKTLTSHCMIMKSGPYFTV